LDVTPFLSVGGKLQGTYLVALSGLCRKTSNPFLDTRDLKTKNNRHILLITRAPVDHPTCNAYHKDTNMKQITLTTIAAHSKNKSHFYRKIIKDIKEPATQFFSLINVMQTHYIPHRLQDLLTFLKTTSAPAILYSHLNHPVEFIGHRNKTNLDDDSNLYLPIDIDSFNEDTPHSDEEIFLQVETFLKSLPIEFQQTNYIVQLSSSFGRSIKPGLIVALVYVLDGLAHHAVVAWDNSVFQA
jgi:hypothetical protein